jgi:hypothetical protein
MEGRLDHIADAKDNFGRRDREKGLSASWVSGNNICPWRPRVICLMLYHFPQELLRPYLAAHRQSRPILPSHRR